MNSFLSSAVTIKLCSGQRVSGRVADCDSYGNVCLTDCYIDGTPYSRVFVPSRHIEFVGGK